MVDPTTHAVSSDTGRWTPCPRWAFDRLTPQALRVYLALNYRCDGDGDDAWPSHSTLAKEVGSSVSTVKRALRECAEAGAITIEQRMDEAGDWTSNRYIVFRSDPTLVNRGGVTGDPTRGFTDDPTGGVTDDLRTRTHSEQEPSELLRQAQFNEFYALFPRKKKKGEARTAYMAAIDRGAIHAEIMAGLIANMADLRHQIHLCPYPATWLDAERWNDEPDYEPAEGEGVFG